MCRLTRVTFVISSTCSVNNIAFTLLYFANIFGKNQAVAAERDARVAKKPSKYNSCPKF